MTGTEAARDWRKILMDPVELAKFMMYLLKKAFQIYNGAPIKTQDVETAKAEYTRLTHNKIKMFLARYYQLPDHLILGLR